MSVALNQDWIRDVRDPVEGDSYNWAGTEPTTAKTSLVIHHSGTPSQNGSHEDAFSIASYHVHGNGWGGIGYHFVITHDSYPGGAQIQYAGDLGSWRAHVANNNPGRVGICLTGDMRQQAPGVEQLKLARRLIEFLIAPNNILPNLGDFSQVTYHRNVIANSECPGNLGDWFQYLAGGDEPGYFPKPEAPPAPEYIATYKESRYDAVTKSDGFAVDMTGAGAPIGVPRGSTVNIAGTFTDNGKEYVRTVYSASHDKWYGLPKEVFDEVAEVPVVVNEPTPGSVNSEADNTKAQEDLLKEHPAEVTEQPKVGVWFRLLMAIFGPIIKLFGRK